MKNWEYFHYKAQTPFCFSHPFVVGKYLELLSGIHGNICLFPFRDASGKFPEYPTEDEGGSNAIFKPKDPAEVNIYMICLRAS